MGYSEAFINRTKAQLLEHNRKLSREIAALNKEHDIQVESYNKVVAENQKLHDELSSKEASNKKLADQFYEYRTELVKVRKELSDAIEKRDSFKVELEGVRGALKRESELRVDTEKKRDELREKLVKMESEFEAFKKAFSDKDIECDELRNKAWKWDKIHELVNAHGIDTLSKLEDALVELEHKREDVESLKTSLADSCAAKIKEGHDLTAKIESLERELCSAKEAMARDAEEAQKWHAWYDDLKTLWDKVRKERDDMKHVVDDVEEIQRKHNVLTLESLDNALKQWGYIDGKLSRDLCMPLESLIQLLDEYGVNDFCKLRERLMYGPTTDYINALSQVKKLEKENKDLKAVADDLEKQRKKVAQNFEKAARKNDELQCEVNRLTQKVQDFEKRLPGTYLAFPQPDDEICGRKIKEWMGYNAVLVKYGVPSPESLDAKLDPFEPARLTATRSYNVMVKYGINDEKELDESLERLDRFQQMLRDWHFRTIDEFSTYINELHNYKIICEQNLISSTDELKKSFDELKAFRLSPFRSLGKEWRDVVDKYHVASANELDKCLNQRQRMHHTLHMLKKDIEQFNQP